MKKLKYLIITFILGFIFNINAYAVSSSFAVTSTSVYVGDSFTVTVKLNGVAAWNVHTSVTGPVEGCIINQADASQDGKNTNKTFTASCKATQTGTIKIELTGDATYLKSDNTDDSITLSGSKSVTVKNKPTPSPSPSQSPSPSPSQSPSPSPSPSPSSSPSQSPTPSPSTQPSPSPSPSPSTPSGNSQQQTNQNNQSQSGTNTQQSGNNNSQSSGTTSSIRDRIKNRKNKNTQSAVEENNNTTYKTDDKVEKTFILLGAVAVLFVIYIASMIFVQKKNQ